MRTIDPGIVSTVLKHLTVRKNNFFTSIVEHPDDPNKRHWNDEIENIDIAIQFFEGLRADVRKGIVDVGEDSA